MWDSVIWAAVCGGWKERSGILRLLLRLMWRAVAWSGERVNWSGILDNWSGGRVDWSGILDNWMVGLLWLN